MYRAEGIGCLVSMDWILPYGTIVPSTVYTIVLQDVMYFVLNYKISEASRRATHMLSLVRLCLYDKEREKKK